MSNKELLRTKTQEEIQLVAEDPPPPAESEIPQPGASQLKTANEAQIKYKDDAQKLLKELPSDEFLNFLEQSSPEQLQFFLNQLAPSKQPVSQALRSLFGTLVSIPDEPRNSFSIIGWWEARRILFNTVVLLCGLPTLAIIYFAGLASLKFAVTGSIEYAILANICYCAGWICELIARSWWKQRARHLGPILFTLGFAFSVLLTMGAGFIMVVLFALLSLLRGF